VKKREIAYRAPARSQRNAFGAYALYDLVARLVLGDQQTYSSGYAGGGRSPSSGNWWRRFRVSRKKGTSRCLIATPERGAAHDGAEHACVAVHGSRSAA
jgi:hypothetical protein